MPAPSLDDTNAKNIERQLKKHFQRPWQLANLSLPNTAQVGANLPTLSRIVSRIPYRVSAGDSIPMINRRWANNS